MKRITFLFFIILNLNAYAQSNIPKDSVIQIGYGEQKKTNITGAISSLSNPEVNLLHVSSVESALQGQVAGVSVVNEGGPGVNPIVRIRGNGSISYAASPLYVVDGIPTFELGSINPYDIGTLNILKDAGATAIYGSRGANGVILITTKKGMKSTKVRVTLDSYVGVQSIPKTLDLLNTDQYLQYGKTLNANSGLMLPSRFSNMDQPIYAGTTQTYAQTNTDWQDALFQKAMITNSNLSFSAGTEKSTFYASAGYLNQDGIMVGTGYKRYSFRLNSEHQIFKRVKLGQTFTYTYGDRNNEKELQGRTTILHAIRSVPYIPVNDPTTTGGYRSAASGIDGTDAVNPILIQKLLESTTSTSKFLASLYLEIKIADYLTFKSTLGYDYLKKANHTYLPIYYDGYNSNSADGVFIENQKFDSKLFINQLTFNKTWDNHNLTAEVITEQKSYTDELIIKSRQSSGGFSENGWTINNKVRSYVGRLSYNYKEKYLINMIISTDSPSTITSANKWEYFPSVSMGWRVDQEPFLSQSKLISQLKLRVSQGKVGFNTETSSITNIGLDMGFIKDKFSFSAEWFNKITDNLILAALYDPSIGYNAPYFTNIGKMTNRGLEFQATAQINQGDLKSTLSGYISFIRNNVNELYANSPIDAGYNQDYGAYNNTRTANGQPIQSFYGWKTDGIFQNATEVTNGHQPNAAPGDIRFKDISGPNGTPDGIIDGYDRTFLGSYLPKFTYGLTYAGSFKQFDFTIFFQGVYGNKIFNGTKVITQGMIRLFNAGTEVLNAWTPTNTNTDIPRAIAGDPNQNTRASDRFIEDGSYLRLKVLSIGYNIPTKCNTFLEKHNIKIRIYLMGQNLLTFTKYTGYDPEVGAYPPPEANGQHSSLGSSGTSTAGLLNNGVDYGFIPPARTLLAGIHIDF